MADGSLALLRRQIDRARRRLLACSLGRWLLRFFTAVLLLSGLFLLVRAEGHFRDEPQTLPVVLRDRLVWVGLALVAGAVGALVLVFLRRPSRLAAALALDRALRLEERMTTVLSLAPDQETTPAGRALVADTCAHLVPASVSAAFPLRPARSAWLVPVGLIAVCLAALFCEAPAPAKLDPEDDRAVLVQADELARRLEKLAPQARGRSEKPTALRDEARDIDAELERLAGQTPTTKGEARELLKDVTSLEDRIRRHEKGLADRAAALRQQAEEADRLTPRKKPDQPPSPAEQSLKEGDFRKTGEELNRLSRELDQQQLTAQQKEQLRQQIKDLEDHLARLADLKEKQDRALDRAPTDQLSPEEREEIEQAKQVRAQELARLKEVAARLEDAREKMDAGKEEGAARQLAEAGKGLKGLDTQPDQERLARQLAQLEEARQTLAESLGNQPNPAAGKRPETRTGKTGEQEQQVKGPRDQGRLTGFRHVPGTGLRGPRNPIEFQGAINEAGREAAEAIERQRLPRSFGDTARGYFERLRGPEKRP